VAPDDQETLKISYMREAVKTSEIEGDILNRNQRASRSASTARLGEHRAQTGRARYLANDVILSLPQRR